MLYILYKIGEAISLGLPIWVSYRIAEFIADMKYYLSPNDRMFVKENLRVVLGESSREDVDRVSKDVFRNFGKYLVEFFRFPKIDSDFIKNRVKIKNPELIEEALKENKGLILLSAHIGNWELGGAVIGMLGYKANVIALDHKESRVNDFFIKRRFLKNVNVIPLGFALKKCLRALGNNEILALLGDRDFSKNGIEVNFFNKKAIMPKGPAVLKLKTGAAVIGAFLIRDPDNSFTFYFQKPKEIKIESFNEDAVKKLTESYLEMIEDVIRKYPDQWYVFRKIWK